MPEYIYLDYDTDTLHEEYNNRAKVPDFADIISNWQRRSNTATKSADNGQLDLPYGEGSRQRLDLFLPRQANPPLHVFIHGGYWQALEKEPFNFLSAAFNDAGIAFANIEYTLCPQTDLKGIVAETRAALGWLYRNAHAYGYASDNIHISGHSAGGHLAAMLAATNWSAQAADLPPNLISSAMPISGIFDLEPLRHIPIGDKLAIQPDEIRSLSPANMPINTATSTLIALGALEGREFHRQAEQMAAVYRRQNVMAPIRSVAARNHFTILEELAAPDGALFSAALQMIKSK